jgi:antitoxin HigA-1
MSSLQNAIELRNASRKNMNQYKIGSKKWLMAEEDLEFWSNKVDEMSAIHPGFYLKRDYLTPLKKTPHWLAKKLNVPVSRINDIVLGRRGITADTALRLAAFFGHGALMWLNLQAMYDLKVARQKSEAQILGMIEPLKG